MPTTLPAEDRGRPLALPTEAPGPKAEYLVWHRSAVFGK